MTPCLITLAIFQANSVDGVKVKDALENLQVHVDRVRATSSRFRLPTMKLLLNMIVMGEIRNGKVAYAYRKTPADRLRAKNLSKPFCQGSAVSVTSSN